MFLHACGVSWYLKRKSCNTRSDTSTTSKQAPGGELFVVDACRLGHRLVGQVILALVGENLAQRCIRLAVWRQLDDLFVPAQCDQAAWDVSAAALLMPLRWLSLVPMLRALQALMVWLVVRILTGHAAFGLPSRARRPDARSPLPPSWNAPVRMAGRAGHARLERAT